MKEKFMITPKYVYVVTTRCVVSGILIVTVTIYGIYPFFARCYDESRCKIQEHLPHAYYSSGYPYLAVSGASSTSAMFTAST